MKDSPDEIVAVQSGFNAMLLTALRALTRMSLSYLSSMEIEVVLLSSAPALRLLGFMHLLFHRRH